MTMDIVVVALAYIVPTFAIAYTWHLNIFAARYAALEMYRENVAPPLGLSSMLIQSIAFALIYWWIAVPESGSLVVRALAYFAFGFLLSASFTVLAVAGKNRMTSIGGFIAIETAFTAVQWAVVAVATVLVAP